MRMRSGVTLSRFVQLLFAADGNNHFFENGQIIPFKLLVVALRFLLSFTTFKELIELKRD